MFYDERIELEKGKICRNSIIISMVLAFVWGGIRLANIAKHTDEFKYFLRLMPEFSIVLLGLVFLGICALRGGRGSAADERSRYEQCRLYNQLAPLYIRVLGILLAIVIPVILFIGTPVGLADGNSNGIFTVIFLAVGAYAMYSFKKQDICLNYSIIDSDRYYRSVLKKYGKFLLYVLLCFLCSLLVFLWVDVQMEVRAETWLAHLKTIGTSYLKLIFQSFLLYLLVSFLELDSYRKENRISKSVYITLGIVIFFRELYAIAVFLAESVTVDGITAISSQFLNTLNYLLTPTLSVAVLLFLLYFSFEYTKLGNSKGFLLGTRCLLLHRVLHVLISQLRVQIVVLIFLPLQPNEEHLHLYNAISLLVNALLNLFRLLGFGILLGSLVRDQIIRKGHYWVFAVIGVLLGVNLFLRFQADMLMLATVAACAEAVGVLYLGYLLSRIIRATE